MDMFNQVLGKGIGKTGRLLARAFAHVLLLASYFLFPSCGPSRVYEQDFPLTGDTWQQDSALIYKVQIDDPARAYDLFYHVRYDLDYPYYNLYVKLSVEDSAGTELFGDRHELILMDPQTGKPTGSGLGGVYDKEFTAQQRLRFRKAGVYRVRLAQYMRVATLPGMHEFGIHVAESE